MLEPVRYQDAPTEYRLTEAALKTFVTHLVTMGKNKKQALNKHTPDIEGIVESIIDDPRVKPFWDKIPYTKSKILEHPEGVTIINYLNGEISELYTTLQSQADQYQKEIDDLEAKLNATNYTS